MIAAVIAWVLRWKLALLIGGATAAIAGAYLWADGQGWHRADLEWRTKWAEREQQIAEERADYLDRLASINAADKAAEAREIADYQVKLDAANVLTIQLADEAAKDPDANLVVFDAAAIDRYNRSIAR